MSVDLKSFLKHKALNKWGLFCLLSIPISILVIIEMLSVDLSTGDGVSAMIGYSVRWAVPFIYLVVAASSAQILFPGPFTNWWARNRKYIGLTFAAAMAWQGLFIFMMSTFFRDYYFEEVYYFRDEIEGSVGYIFLGFMVVTSFVFARRLLDLKQWKLIQKGGIYWLWAYPFSVYWWNLYYYPNPPELHDHIFYWAGFIAFLMRILAWGKKRQAASTASPLKVNLGRLLVVIGLLMSPTGHYWYKAVNSVLTANAWSADMEIWLPFWPLEPFIPLLVIGIGVMIMTQSSTSSAAVKLKSA
ncbi:MAG: hypothetical protein ACJAYG_002340 [Oceanicoccus sp.]|jgi:hypothetical protein